MSALLKDIPLSEEQRIAVVTDHPSTVVQAGAGTGKTHALKARVVFLAEQGVAPEEIIAISFTRQACGELDLRLRRMLGASFVESLWVGTFHATALMLLRYCYGPVGVLDGVRQLQVIRAVLEEGSSRALLNGRPGTSELADSVLRRIGQGYHMDVSSELLLHGSEDVVGQLAVVCRERLEELERVENVLQLDRMIPAANEALRSDASLREWCRKLFRHVLVDEAQDCDPAQHNFLQLLAGPETALWVIGDSNQSIYGFRGASPEHLDRLAARGQQLTLRQNRRCSAPVLAAANALISRNASSGQLPLLGGDAQLPGVARMLEFRSERQEGERIAASLRLLHDQQGVRWEDMQVLGPNHRVLESLHEELLACGVPYTPSNGIHLAGRVHIQPAICLLRVASGLAVSDEQVGSVFRLAPGIGATRAERLVSSLGAGGLLGLDVKSLRVPEESRAALEQVIGHARAMRARIRDGLAAGPAVEMALAGPFGPVETQRHKAESGSENAAFSARRAQRDIEAFRSSATRYAEQHCCSVGELVVYLEGQRTDAASADGGQVSLSTIHAAKGLEGRVIFLLGLEEGQLPNRHADEPRLIEQQRRLCYVGMTRARQSLFVCTTLTRNRNPQHRSRFVFEAGLA